MTNPCARALRAYASPQFALFVVFGGTAALVNLAVGVTLYDRGLLPGLPYWISVSIAAFSGLIVNFALNYFFNLKFRQRSAFEQFRTFCVIAIIGIMLTVAIADALLRLVTECGITELSLPLGHVVSMRFAMHVCAVGIVTFYSYAAHRYFSFNVGIRSRLRPILSRRG